LIAGLIQKLPRLKSLKAGNKSVLVLVKKSLPHGVDSSMSVRQSTRNTHYHQR